MFMRWRRRREPGWQAGLVINLVGAIATGIVAIIVAVTKFCDGAWMIVVVIPLLILLMRGDPRALHSGPRAELADEHAARSATRFSHTVIVPISSLNRVALQTLAYARSISRRRDRGACHATTRTSSRQFRAKWEELGTAICRWSIIESPYRALVGPLLSYIDEIDKQRPDDTLTVVLPEFVRAPLVGAPAAQPDGAAAQGGAALPPGHRRDQRPLPPRTPRMTVLPGRGEVLGFWVFRSLNSQPSTLHPQPAR